MDDDNDDVRGSRTNDDPRLEPSKTGRYEMAPGGSIGTSDTMKNTDKPTEAQLNRYARLKAEKERAEAFEDMRKRIRDPEHRAKYNLLRGDFKAVRGELFEICEKD